MESYGSSGGSGSGIVSTPKLRFDFSDSRYVLNAGGTPATYRQKVAEIRTPGASTKLTQTTDASRPIFLRCDSGEPHYLNMFGEQYSWAFIDHSANQNPTTSLEIEVELSPAESEAYDILGKGAKDVLPAWGLIMDFDTGVIGFYAPNFGVVSSSATGGFAANTVVAVRVRATANSGGQSLVEFWYSLDHGENWTACGSVVGSGGPKTFTSSTEDIQIGTVFPGIGHENRFDGRIFSILIRRNNVIVVDMDLRSQPTGNADVYDRFGNRLEVHGWTSYPNIGLNCCVVGNGLLHTDQVVAQSMTISPSKPARFGDIIFGGYRSTWVSSYTMLLAPTNFASPDQIAMTLYGGGFQNAGIYWRKDSVANIKVSATPIGTTTGRTTVTSWRLRDGVGGKESSIYVNGNLAISAIIPFDPLVGTSPFVNFLSVGSNYGFIGYAAGLVIAEEPLSKFEFEYEQARLAALIGVEL